MRLVLKLAAGLLLGMTLVLTVHGVLTARRELAVFDATQRRSSRLLGHALAVAMAERWQSAGKDNALAFLEDIASRDHDVGIRWIEVTTGKPSVRLDGRQMARLARGKQVAFVKSDGNATRTLYTLVPAAIEGRAGVGAIEIAVSLADHDAYIRSTVFRLTLAGIAVLALNLVLSVMLGRYWIGSPIRKVIAKARAVGGGQLDTPLEIRAKDEIGDLAREIKTMAAQLAAQRETVERAHRERLEAQEQLRHAERLATVGKLAAGIAHEIGTPLNVADGYTKKILSGGITADETASCAQVIGRQIKRIAVMVKDLMRFARRQAPRRAPVELLQLALDTASLLESLGRKSGVEITVQGTPSMVLADANEIQQVLINLITNGMQAMPRGGKIGIWVHNERRKAAAPQGGTEKDCGCVTVEDAGTGIAEANLPHVFDPFFTTKDVGEGTGLGLSIAHGIVRDHGGWIEVDSEVGKGSRFTFCLPATTDG
jgi:two-component system NtrC family sensor kinase